MAGEYARRRVAHHVPLAFLRFVGRDLGPHCPDADMQDRIENSQRFIEDNMLLRLRRHDIGQVEESDLFGDGQFRSPKIPSMTQCARVGME